MSELSESNYKRIVIINWLLSVPMMVLFAWPYYYATKLVGMDESFRYLGAFMFALPFMITILHGHVTMALGSVHRQHYYDWLHKRSFSFGLFFFPILVSTRFRMMILIISLAFLPVGYLLAL